MYIGRGYTSISICPFMLMFSTIIGQTFRWLPTSIAQLEPWSYPGKPPKLVPLSRNCRINNTRQLIRKIMTTLNQSFLLRETSQVQGLICLTINFSGLNMLSWQEVSKREKHNMLSMNDTFLPSTTTSWIQQLAKSMFKIKSLGESTQSNSGS